MGLISRLYDNDDGETDNGCTHHHFEEYEATGDYEAEVNKERRHYQRKYEHSGEWVSAQHPTFLNRELRVLSDERTVVYVYETVEAVCEHHGCRETDEKREKVDQYVIESSGI